MEDQKSAPSAIQVFKGYLNNDATKDRFEEILGRKSAAFVASVLQVYNGSDQLQKCNPVTIINAAFTAAALDLPVVPALGRSYIVPYGTVATFMIGYKGFIDLAQRSGRYHRINSIPVYANQFKYFDELNEELMGNFTIPGEGQPIGYAAYFKLDNGFEKVVYWSMDRIKAHATKYSKTYQKKSRNGGLVKSPWNDPDQFDSMAMKTVIKYLLNNWGPLSVEMQTAIQADFSVQETEGQFEYLDNDGKDENGNTAVTVKAPAVQLEMENAESLEALTKVFEDNEATIKKDLNLLRLYGQLKGEYEDGK